MNNTKGSLDQYVIIDTETTGLTPHSDNIVEIGALKIENNRIVDTFREYIKPKNLYRFNSATISINGITEATVRNAATAESVLPRFLNFVGDSVVIAHNAKFDLDFINADLADINGGLTFQNKYIDSLGVSRECFPTAPNHKLATLVSYLQLNAKNAHNVLDDCYCVYELINKAVPVLEQNNKSLNKFIRLNYYARPQEEEKKPSFYEYKKSELTSFTEIHKNAPKIYSRYELSKLAANLQPQKYVVQTFNKPMPYREQISRVLRFEAERQIKSILFRARKISKYVSDNIDLRFNEEYSKWVQEKEQFEDNQNIVQQRENKKFEKQYKNQLKHISEQCAGKEEFITSNINTALADKKFPYQMEYEFDLNIEEGTVGICTTLPAIEQIPAEKYTYGSVIGKKKTQKEIKFEYVQCAFSNAVYIASLIFEISPKIQHVILSETAKRRNKDGDLNSECLLSVKFNREPFENSNIQDCQPQEFCMQFENRCNITTTGIMKAVKPFEFERVNQ